MDKLDNALLLTNLSYYRNNLDKVNKFLEPIDKKKKYILDKLIINLSKTKKIYPINSDEAILEKINNEIATNIFSNENIGLDYHYIRYSIIKILFLLFILDNEKLNNEEIGTSENEIIAGYYFLLNTIYNIKEKINNYFCYSKNKNAKGIINSIFTINGNKLIQTKINDFFSKISKYCKARDAIVHDKYSIKFDNIKREMIIICHIFDFSDKNYWESKSIKYIFKLNIKEFENILYSLIKIIEEIIIILNDIKNIDKKKFLLKFYDKKEKMYKITF